MDQTVSFMVSDGTALTVGDYIVTGHIGKEAGTYTVTVTAVDSGNYAGSVSNTWIIHKRALVLIGQSAEMEYNRVGHTLSEFSVEGIVPGHHVAGITYSASAVHVGVHDGEFIGTLQIHDGYEDNVVSNYDVVMVVGTLTIIPKDISSAQVVLGPVPTYDGTEHVMQILSVTVDELVVLTYLVEGNAGTDAGTYVMRVIGIGDYRGTVEKVWYIDAKDISSAQVVLGPEVVYDGSVKTQTVESVTVDGMEVTYIISGNTAVDVGDYVLTVTGIGNFRGAVAVDWSIDVPITYVTVIWPDEVYIHNGEVQEIDLILVAENGDVVPYHLEFYDLEGNPVEFRDIGTYVVKVVIDDSAYVLDVEPYFIVEIVPEESTGMSIGVLIMALIVAALAAYLPISHLLKPDMRDISKTLMILMGLGAAAILLTAMILIAGSEGAVLIASVVVAALAAYLPLSYMIQKK